MTLNKNWNILPSLYEGQEGLKNILKMKQDLEVGESILRNMQRMNQQNTPQFSHWKSVVASRKARYERFHRLRSMSEAR